MGGSRQCELSRSQAWGRWRPISGEDIISAVQFWQVRLPVSLVLRRIFENILTNYLRGDWKQHAAQVLNENGFSNAQQYHIEHGMLEARYWNDMWVSTCKTYETYWQWDRYMSTWAEFASKTMSRPEEAKTLAAEAMKEVRRGSTIHCPMWIWVAQKDWR